MPLPLPGAARWWLPLAPELTPEDRQAIANVTVVRRFTGMALSRTWKRAALVLAYMQMPTCMMLLNAWLYGCFYESSNAVRFGHLLTMCMLPYGASHAQLSHDEAKVRMTRMLLASLMACACSSLLQCHIVPDYLARVSLILVTGG